MCAVGGRSAGGCPGARCARYWWRVDWRSSVVDCTRSGGQRKDGPYVFTSALPFGLNHRHFRGAVRVAARVVNAATVVAMNGLPTVRLPDDGGLRAGLTVGPVESVTVTGDLTNRLERRSLKLQSASVSWAQFAAVFLAF